MKQTFKKTAVLACAAAALVAMTATTQAESASSVEYHGGKKAYDKRIEQAAIKRAASKIGELRGSIDTQSASDDGHILTDVDLMKKSGALGFPVIVVPSPDRETVTGAVRIM